MASIVTHQEIKNWKKIENMIEFYKFKISHTFPILYWSIGIFFTILLSVLITQSEKIISFTGIFWWIVLVVVLTTLLIISINLINKVHKSSADDLEYLYRKMDGQNV